MVSLAGLIGIGGLSFLVAEGGLKGSAHDRFQSAAMHAAESGVAAGMTYLRSSYDGTTYWSSLVSPANDAIQQPTDIIGNAAQPGDSGATLSSDTRSWYEVTVLNNPGDPQFEAGTDGDGRVILHAVGHGPDDATVILEVEVSGDGLLTTSTNCNAYGQRGMSENGAGRSDCMGEVQGTVTGTYQPGS